MTGSDLAVAARGVLAVVLVVAGAAKLAARPSPGEVAELGVPGGLAPLVAVGLAPAEIVVGALVSFVGGIWPVTLALALLLVFTGVAATALARGVRVPCRCFGALDRAPLGPPTLVRDAVLVGLALLATGTSRAPL